MSASSDTLLQQAQTAVKAGHKVEARHLLQQVVAEDDQSFKAWLLLASVTSAPQAAAAYVERAALLAPTHPAVIKAQRWAAEQTGKPATAVPVSPVAPPAAAPSQARSVPNGRFWSRLFTLGVALLLMLIAFWIGRSTWQQTAQLAPPTAAAVAAVPDNNAAVDEAANPFSRTAATDETAPQAFAVPDSAGVAPAVQPAADGAEADAAVADSASGPSKNVGSALPRPTWTPTPLPTPTLAPTSTPAPTEPPPPVPEQAQPIPGTAVVRPAGVGPGERWIDVNLSTQTLVALEGDTPVLQSLISSGTSLYPTVTGQFRTYLKHESQDMNGYLLGYDYYLADVPYVMYFYRDFAIHGTYWHNNFGTPMSHGCVNVNTIDAGWLFNWAPVGTLVNVHY